jgi:uncharacterized protein YjbJ (UPF0337 family)
LRGRAVPVLQERRPRPDIDPDQPATSQVTTMGTIKRAIRRVAGKTKEVIAEVVGDGKLQEESQAEQRKSEEEDKEPGTLNPLGNLHRLT